eukprot:CAMPEP_0174254652 /NCGR_PEP_ID=MMETSP0439-20130205/3971_1 /TAXON_ID=0 /ORGANISM="Stereomyxa ramosa, Strain Chinc5" /LENGTH=256 /DNA_ID=CAMNT_0015336367 /DNA_START=141 /DNA_END=911 /DNA_ORIENTATION=-
MDHFVRRNEGQSRVIGTLLGVNTEGVVEITNSFPVPHTETEDKVAVDFKYHRNMYDLQSRAHPQEMIVGWYATGGIINDYSVGIHDFYWREMQAPPVHMLVDTGLTNNNLSIRAFMSSSLSFSNPEVSLGFQFKDVQLEFMSNKPEQTALSRLANEQNEENMVQEADNLKKSFEHLLSLLETVSTYVDRVVSGELTADPKVGRMLFDVVSRVGCGAASFEKMFSKSQTDLLMVIYLSNLTRTQLAITEKLQTFKEF